jgi:transcriptional regulator with XRE-family HTH domain
VRRTVVDPRFHAELVRLILDSGTSQADIARRANVSPSYLSQIINGTRTPDPSVVRKLDAALDADGRLADLVAPATGPYDQDVFAAVATDPRRAGTAAVDSLASTLAGQRHLDDVCGSAAMLRPATELAATIVMPAARSTRGACRPPLLTVAAQWAQFVGWLHTSVGRWDDARTWFSRGLEWAIEVDAPDLVATVVSYQAHVAWLTCQWPTAVGLAGAALRDERVYPGQRAYDAYQAARGQAALGEVAEAERLLDLGDELADETAVWAGEIPPWQYYRDPWLWSLERGLVWLFLARHRPAAAGFAVADLAAGVAGIPAEMAGADWAAEYRVHLATAHAHARQFDEAADALERARFVAEATRSGRVMRLVAAGERSLRARRG